MDLKLLGDIKNTREKYKYIDSNGYVYSLSLNDIKDKRSCGHRIFSAHNPYTIQNIHNYIKANNIATQLLSTEFKYAAKNNHLIFKCGLCGDTFKRTWNNFYKGKYKYCQKCISKIQAKEKFLTIDDVRKKCLEKGYKVIQDEYLGNKGHLDIEDKDGYRGRTRWNNINNNEGFIKFTLKNPYFYYNVKNYFKINNYNCNIVENSGKTKKGKFLFVCECGEKYYCTLDEVMNNNKPRIRCKHCTSSISSGEKAVTNWLIKNNINFKFQYRFKDCKYIRPLIFDFYLPDYNICIEFDGAYHYKKQPHVTDEQFYLQKERDNIKSEYCNNNGIKLIRIPYWELYNKKYKDTLIKNILV